MSEVRKRNSQKGATTRQQILLRACDVASVEGLEGLTIGRLAEVTGLSKSGLIRHFESKEGLQLAIVELAYQRFQKEVVEPVLEVEAGLLRLKALMRAWLRYLESGPYSGGCLWYQAAADFDGRPGSIKAKLAEIFAERFELIRHQVAIAMAKRQIETRGRTAADLAFAIQASIQESILMRQLVGHPEASLLGKRAVESVIGAIG